MKVIVVGVDGSAASSEALKWAVVEGRARDENVQAVYVWSWPHDRTEIGHLAGGPLHEQLRVSAEQLLQRCVASVGLLGSPGLELVVIEGSPARALVDFARDADLLVVGSRGRGGLVGSLLGSVSRRCAQEAHCPVVVIHEGTVVHTSLAHESHTVT